MSKISKYVSRRWPEQELCKFDRLHHTHHVGVVKSADGTATFDNVTLPRAVLNAAFLTSLRHLLVFGHERGGAGKEDP